MTPERPVCWRVRLIVRPAIGDGAWVAAFAWNDPDGETCRMDGFGSRYLDGTAPVGTDRLAAGMQAAVQWLRSAALRQGVGKLEITVDPELSGRYRATAFDPEILVMPAPTGEADPGRNGVLPNSVTRLRLAMAKLDAYWQDVLHGKAERARILPVAQAPFPALVESVPGAVFVDDEKQALLDAYAHDRLRTVRDIVRRISDRDGDGPPDRFDQARAAACMCLSRQADDEARACMSASYMVLATASAMCRDDPRMTVRIYRVIRHIERDDPDNAWKALLKILHDPDLTALDGIRTQLAVAACALMPLVDGEAP